MENSGLRPFFTFYGGKWRAAPRYPSPEHDTIIEPFAGSAGYSLRYPHKKILLVEKDPVIASVWRYLIGADGRDIMALPDFLPGDHLDDTKFGWICSGAKSLIGFWLNKGCSRPRKTPSAWMRSGTHSNSFWGYKIKTRIAGQLPFIRHWRVIGASYAKADRVLCGKRRATWFIDPPYERAGVHYRESRIDYEHLARWCLSRRGQVIVCENEGAEWLPFKTLGTLKANESKTGGKRSREVIWTNDAD